MNKNLERIVRKGGKLLGGLGLISLLSVPGVVGCGSEKDKDYYSPSNGSYTPPPDPKLEAWKKCCACLGNNNCMTKGSTYSSCVNTGSVDININCQETYCSSKCSGLGETTPYCVECGEKKNGSVYLHDEWCPSDMYCALTTGGAICMPEGKTSYNCIL